MRVFKDRKGREWEVDINVASRAKLRAKLDGFDVAKLADDGAKGLGELLADQDRMVQVLYILCQEQIEKLCLTPEDFGAAFSGDALRDSTKAFTEELIDFFPSLSARETLRKLLSKGEEFAEIAAQKAIEELDNLNLPQLLSTLTKSSGVAPGELESTQALSLSASS